MRRISLPFLCAVVAVVAMAGCGGSSNPAGPSSASAGVTLEGVVLSGTSASSAPGQVMARDGSTGRITVTVQENTSISTTVSINGTFKLDGLPQTGFTLVFSVNGVTVGTITVTPIQGSTDIKIVVQVTTTTVVLVNLDLGNENESQNGNGNGTCMIDGGKVGQHIELEGTVNSGSSSSFKLSVNGNRSSGLVDVAASGAQLKCNGSKNSTSCSSSVTAGAQVHVKGTLTSCSTTAAAVTATEVMVQK